MLLNAGKQKLTKLHWGAVSSNEMYSTYKCQRIVYYFNQGHKAPTISRLLRAEGLSASRRGIHKYKVSPDWINSKAPCPGSGRPSKITEEVKAIVDEQMNKDDETTAYQLHRLLVSCGYNISIHTILRCRSSLGWIFCGTSYCQLIRHVNKQKSLDWAQANTDLAFEDVIWTVECTVQLQSHHRFCCRKKGQPVKHKPR